MVTFAFLGKCYPFQDLLYSDNPEPFPILAVVFSYILPSLERTVSKSLKGSITFSSSLLVKRVFPKSVLLPTIINSFFKLILQPLSVTSFVSIFTFLFISSTSSTHKIINLQTSWYFTFLITSFTSLCISFITKFKMRKVTKCFTAKTYFNTKLSWISRACPIPSLTITVKFLNPFIVFHIYSYSPQTFSNYVPFN